MAETISVDPVYGSGLLGRTRAHPVTLSAGQPMIARLSNTE